MKIKTLSSNNEITYKTVTDVWATTVEKPRQLIVELANGTKLHCSNNHPVMVQGAVGVEQVDAEHLTAQHVIITDTGTTTVASITADDTNTQYVDLSVEDTEVFFTADSIDNNMILTHNCSQGGIRGGSATGYYPWWHLEFPELIVLKNNSGTEESRERHIDYGVEINKFLFDRFVADENITLFSPHEVPELKDAFYRGTNTDFERVYAELEQKPGIKKRVVSAKEMIYNIASERQKTGRIYINFIDNMMQQGPFERLLPTQYLMSNLCLEIALPVIPFNEINSDIGQIALCTLSSSNWGKLSKPADLEKPCRSMVRALDNLLSYQEYPVKPAENFTKAFRALGIGIVGFAHFLARRGLKYNIDAAEIVDEYMEAMAYYLTDESVRIAAEKGACEGFDQTCYARGIFPWEKRNKNIDRVVKHKLRYNWEELRERLKKYGIRNATLMAVAPTESSSILLGETNGIEPPIMDIVEKKSKDGILKQLVPGYHNLKNKYDYKWEQADNKGYLILMAVIQKWTDQAISSNTNYDPGKFPDSKIPLSLLVQDLMFSHQLGLKTLYYQNMNDMNTDVEASANQQTIVDEVCESCVI